MTKIEWTDESWNPVTGCTKCSPGCANCYAEANISRLQANPKTAEKYRNGFKVTMHPDELEKPLHWKKPRKIFLCSMGDLFHEDVPFEFIVDVMTVMCLTSQHTYQVLTKRPERMAEYFNKYIVPSNAWFGVTVCNQDEADKKIPILETIPATIKFISIEPMLTPIDLTRFLVRFRCWGCKFETPESPEGFICPRCRKTYMGSQYFSPAIDWVIVGGETGRNARPMNPDWARAIRDQCRVSETPFFFKQMSNKQPIPDDLCVREFPTRGER